MSDFAIGDISGFKKTFDKLITSVPGITRIIAMGDIIDRGPYSKEMIEFFMNNSQHQSLMGNHEHMFIKVYEQIMFQSKQKYHALFWIYVNGGRDTLKSYGIDIPDIGFTRQELVKMSKTQIDDLMQSQTAKYIFAQFDQIPKEHIEFLKTLPLTIETDQAFYSHAPVTNWKNPKLFQYQEFENNDFLLDNGTLWNRTDPKRSRTDKKLQVYGHQNKDLVLAHTDKNPVGIYVKDKAPVLPKGTWGVCLDTAKAGFLTGLKVDDMTLHYENIPELQK